MRNRITYKRLRNVLAELGFASESVKLRAAEGSPAINQFVFRHPDRDQVIILPHMRDNMIVKPIDLLRVRLALTNSGAITDEDFKRLFHIAKGDKLIWNEPTTRKQIHVTAASDETDDGMVIVKQKGTFAPCPVDQLQRVPESKTSGRHG